MRRRGEVKPSKVDLADEPYRYACPHCGGTGSYLVKRQKSARVTSTTRYMDVEPVQAHGGRSNVDMSEVDDYRCDKCSSSFDEPVDKKA